MLQDSWQASSYSFTINMIDRLFSSEEKEQKTCLTQKETSKHMKTKAFAALQLKIVLKF